MRTKSGTMVNLADILDENDRAVYAASGYGARAGFGVRPVLLVVDVNFNFCGDSPKPILESVKLWRNSCGEQAWAAVPQIAALIADARAHRIPIIYSTGADLRSDGFEAGRWADKNSRRGEDHARNRLLGNEIVPPIAPQPHDLVIKKGKPSVFFGTQLGSYLTDLQADSVIVCGATTSGCVRATVLDGFSNNYRMSVVEECTFDRGQLSHRVNLFDMDQKYADVVSLRETSAFLCQLPRDLFTGLMPTVA